MSAVSGILATHLVLECAFTETGVQGDSLVLLSTPLSGTKFISFREHLMRLHVFTCVVDWKNDHGVLCPFGEPFDA